MRYDNVLILSVALAVSVAAPLSAQRGQRGPGGQRSGEAAGQRAGGGIERILQLREDLELTEQQIVDLNAIRAGQLERRQSAASTAMRLRSDLAAGEITRSEMRDALEESRAAIGAEPGQVREQIDQILNEEQVEALRQAARRTRRSGMRGQARRDTRGQARGQARGQRGGRAGLRAPNAWQGRPSPRRGFRRGGAAPIGQGFAPARGFRRTGR